MEGGAGVLCLENRPRHRGLFRLKGTTRQTDTPRTSRRRATRLSQSLCTRGNPTSVPQLSQRSRRNGTVRLLISAQNQTSYGGSRYPLKQCGRACGRVRLRRRLGRQTIAIHHRE